jgi:hypothetical protein
MTTRMMRRPLMVRVAARRKMSTGMMTVMAAGMTAEDMAEMSDMGMMITGSAIRARQMGLVARRGSLDL